MSALQDESEEVAMPHTRSLLRFAIRLTRNSSSAEDLVQETLFLAWRAFRQFDKVTNARAWRFRILINRFNSERRSPGFGILTVPTPEIKAVDSRGSEFLELMEALDRLGPDQRSVLLLAAVEGFSCREIAEILTVPMGTVVSRLSRARDTMRKYLSRPRRCQKVAQ